MNIKTILIIISLILVIGPVMADTDSGEQIDWQVIAGGGENSMTSSSYKSGGTASQTAAGTSSSSSYILKHGFWQSFSVSGECCDMPGDANGNGIINLLDITRIIAYVYQGMEPLECPDEGDVNNDGKMNLFDLTYMIAYLYLGGPAPICGSI